MTKARILIVENEGLIATSLEYLLEQNGYACTGICMDVRSAEACLNCEEVDGVLLDIWLKHDEPSYGLCKMLAKREIPFAFFTGLAREDIKERWRDRPYLGKPFETAQLLDVLEQLIGAKASSVVPIPTRDWRHEAWSARGK